MVMTESNFLKKSVFQIVYKETFQKELRTLHSINFTAQVYFGYTLSTDPSGQFISNAQLAYFTN